jgi:hypothetical protein
MSWALIPPVVGRGVAFAALRMNVMGVLSEAGVRSSQPFLCLGDGFVI